MDGSLLSRRRNNVTAPDTRPVRAGEELEWTRLEVFLPASQDPQFRRSALASSFVAMLELARLGRLDFMQDEPFSAINLRAAA